MIQDLRTVICCFSLASACTTIDVGDTDSCKYYSITAAIPIIGGRTKLLGISKRGNSYLGRMFIHGARAVLWRVKYDIGALREWTTQLQSRAAKNVVVVAPANNLARIAWAVLSSGEHYRTKPAVVAA